ncbi:DMT family transporter [Zobellella sp. DQSA1]|uniref:DMT family transporter n=1 Tax=Zobellella sp. DQSA1 TaxID=3342386 RepID=UPI0035C21DAB
MTTTAKMSVIPLLGLLLLTLIWSFNWIVMKGALDYIGAFDFTALRCALGTLLLFVILRWRGRGMAPPPMIPTAMIGLLQTVGMMGFAQWALVSGGAGKVVIIVYTMPFWVVVLAAFFLCERMRRLQWLAVATGALGLPLVLQPWLLGEQLISSLLALASGFCWGASAIVAKRLYRHHQVDLLALTTWQMAMGTLLLLAMTFFIPQPAIEWSLPLLLALAYNAVLATATAWMLWLFVLRALPAGVAGLSTLAIPVMGVLLAWLLLNERPGFSDAWGVSLILLALGLLSLPALKRSL